MITRLSQTSCQTFLVASQLQGICKQETMTYTYHHKLTHTDTLKPCAQSTLKLWQRSLSSVTTGNKRWSVECVNERLIHSTEPEPTEGAVTLLMAVLQKVKNMQFYS